MKRRNIAARGALVIACLGSLMGINGAYAQTMDSYYAAPPFVAEQAKPNILMLMDNSGSMESRACDSTWCGIPNTSPIDQSFLATRTYTGFFDSLTCYSYNTTDLRFETASTKAAMNTACPNTQWDGNFLNWGTFRRFDAVKKAMIGGDCYKPSGAVRAADGTCNPYGTPSLKTVAAQAKFEGQGDGHEQTAGIPTDNGSNPNRKFQGRVPDAVSKGGEATFPSDIWVQLRGGTDGMAGSFCIDDDNTPPNDSDSDCGGTSGYDESQWWIRVGGTTEPTGVIQQVGAQARFGVAVFNNSSTNDGLKVLTGIGHKQAINFVGTTLETFNTNTAAMIDSIGEAFPATNTPLAETLYEAARYVAQINSEYYSASYVYPIAYSGGVSNGVAFQGSGVGSYGGGEETVMTGTETCPAGYITTACGRDPYFFGSNHTPVWSASSKQVRCCKTFIVLLTDGEPTQDRNFTGNSGGICSAGNLCNYARDNASAYDGSLCTGNRGTPYVDPPGATCNNDPATPTNVLLKQHRTDYGSNGSHYLDDVAYWAHRNDLRPCSGTSDTTIPVLGVTGHCLDGMQNLTIYTFYAFGNIAARELLMHTAMLGAFEDSNGNNVPDLVSEWDKVNNDTGAVGADGRPDAYFESSNVEDLQDRLLATISAIIRKSSSGAAVSVIATSSTGEGALYQAYFYPSTLETATNNDVKWTGYTQSLFVDTFGNLREDTDQDGKLNYKVDLIVATRLDAATNIVYVDKYSDANDGNGIADDQNGDSVITAADCTACGLLLSDIKPIWEAGKRLALTDASARTILTWVDSNHNGIVDTGEQIPFTTANSGTLGPYMRAGAAPYTANAIINFVRGCEIATCAEQASLRDRRLQVPLGSGTLKTWKLGDVIDAPPTIVAAPKDRFDIIEGDPSYSAFFVQYRTRRQVAYVGANDGMLHAFNAGYYHAGDDTTTTTVTEHGWFTRTPTNNSSGPLLGDELWGFVPYELLPHLQWLTRGDYSHVYYVDLPPIVKDVRIFTPDADHPNGWGTVLIGGFRMGGSCGACTAAGGGPTMTVNISGTNYNFYSAYFALDITNPEVQPKLLWSFSSSDLGLSTSVPTVVRVNPLTDFHTDKTNAKWYMVVGSGPTGYDGRAGQSSKLFVVDMATGPGNANSLVSSLPVGSINGYIGDLTGLDRNLDYRADVVYFGRALDDAVPPWRGKLYRLTMGSALPFGGATTAASWGIASGGSQVPTEMIDTIGTTTPVEMGPVITAPAFAIDDTAKVWVFVGSGRYYTSADKTDISTQYFVGVKDDVLNGSCTQTSQTSCQENDLVDVSAASVCVVGVGNCGQAAGTNQVTGVTGATTFTQLITLVGTKEGWFTKLLPASGPGVGERVLSSPTVFGGIVFFPTYTPTNDICASSGSSNLYSLFYKTGGPYSEPIIGTTAGAGGTANVNRSVSLGSGVAFGAVPHVGSGADGTSPYKLFINTSSGAMGGGPGGGPGGSGGPSGDVNLAIDPRAHYASWINM